MLHLFIYCYILRSQRKHKDVLNINTSPSPFKSVWWGNLKKETMNTIEIIVLVVVFVVTFFSSFMSIKVNKEANQEMEDYHE